ncbi:xanthine dehydrogenase family protein molybdopterin-binding subunit [Algoriphagus sp. NG3]|uniref:xanthine dehydrogenase family protein molybdopterin-binding subunit n=1 Tax=Algoriphagus sp. NG3 TaxID=3097546 RepID=UPI002A81A12F|nr:molybdopterin cofactor-binding domain-containing protein [Algoriphagus sp. NG3]WPR76235.1 molybdopterin cofactor-binding domain-containing protein [Algoriphagus sp. NG3]
MFTKFLFRKKQDPENLSKVYIPSRREFLKIGSLATGGFLLGVNFQCSSPKGDPITFAPNAYLILDSDNQVTLIAHRSEMGTGIRTSLPMIIADELGADWSKVKIIQAEGDNEKYGDQNTDGSYSVRMFFEPMRQAGATARLMLISAAAGKWDVDPSECRTEKGQVIHSGGKKVDFGELIEELKKQEIPKPEEVKLKDLKDYQLIGKDVPIYDAKDIALGKAIFGADVDIPGMKIAVIRRSPVIGAKVVSFSDEKALAISGVSHVIKIDGQGIPTGLDKALEGVAVLADNTWAAMQGRKALEVEWDLGPNQTYNSATQLDEMVKSTLTNGQIRREKGDFSNAQRNAKTVLERSFVAPYYAHATMEPPVAIANWKADFCEIWAPTQHPQWARTAVATALGMPEEQVRVNVTLLGGGFGRKSKPDFVVEAALLSKAAQVPVRVQWTREDDIHHDFYHSLSAQRIKVTLDSEGKFSGWNHHTVFPAIGATGNPDELHPSDGELGLGCIDFPFEVPNIRIETHESKAHTRIGWLRSVSNIHHSFAVNGMLDEVAEAQGMDPVDMLLDLLGEDRNISFEGEMKGTFGNYGEPIEKFPWNTGRLKNVIRRVAQEANWKELLAQGKNVGFAAHKSFLTYVACIVEVDKGANGELLIPNVHYVVDCGVPVNTDRIRSQFEGGAQFATSLATTSAISFENGQVQQNNFDGYQVIRMSQSPKNIHVHIIESTEKPTGVGEPPVPPFIPALCNAVYKMTGKRIYELPFKI